MQWLPCIFTLVVVMMLDCTTDATLLDMHHTSPYHSLAKAKPGHAASRAGFASRSSRLRIKKPDEANSLQHSNNGRRRSYLDFAHKMPTSLAGPVNGARGLSNSFSRFRDKFFSSKKANDRGRSQRDAGGDVGVMGDMGDGLGDTNDGVGDTDGGVGDMGGGQGIDGMGPMGGDEDSGGRNTGDDLGGSGGNPKNVPGNQVDPNGAQKQSNDSSRGFGFPGGPPTYRPPHYIVKWGSNDQPQLVDPGSGMGGQGGGPWIMGGDPGNMGGGYPGYMGGRDPGNMGGGDPGNMGGGDPGYMGGDPGNMGGDPGNMGGGDPGNMGGDPGNMGGDPGNMGGGDPGYMGSDPGNMGGDPGNMGGDPGNMGSDPGNMGGGDPGYMGGDPGNMGGDPGNMGGDPGNQGGFMGGDGESPIPLSTLPGTGSRGLFDYLPKNKYGAPLLRNKLDTIVKPQSKKLFQSFRSLFGSKSKKQALVPHSLNPLQDASRKLHEQQAFYAPNYMYAHQMETDETFGR